MLSVTYPECQIQAFYADCRYAECRYAECCYAESRYAECRYAECRYSECCLAECRGVLQIRWELRKFEVRLFF